MLCEWQPARHFWTECTMDPSRFDSITKRLSQTLDRRTLFRSTLTALGAGVLGKPNAAAQTPCTHKLDCAANEICNGQTSGTCAECHAGYVACPVILAEDCVEPFTNRDDCPIWICVDLKQDPLNCGGCAHVCASGTCMNGTCGRSTSNAQQTNASGSVSIVLSDERGARSPYECLYRLVASHFEPANRRCLELFHRPARSTL